MPLVSSVLAGKLAALFAAPPPDAGACGAAWGDAVKDYAGGLVPPSTAVAAAAGALGGALGAAFAAADAAPGMESAFSAFGASVALGQAPLFTGAPPAGPVGFASQFAGPKPETHGAAASAIASLIDTWMRSGTATLVAPPNTITPWS
jgi:hypothetical protein